MTGKNPEAMAQGAVAEARLWRAVIARTVQEWMSGPMRLKREAEEYLFGNDGDFSLVCASAGMDASRLRAALTRVRRQSPGL
jgi:hypothetical protein